MADEIRPDVENAGRERAPADALQAPDEAQVRREARRRILMGGLAGAPLVLTLSSRSAFATHCSPSGMDSANLSRGHDVECLGLTPGYWKTHEQQVSKYVYPGTCNPITDGPGHGQCEDYSVPTAEELQAYIDELKKNEQKNARKIEAAEEYLANLATYPEPESFFGTLFSTIFGDGYTENPNTTMMQALWLDDTPPLPPEGLGGPSPVLAHSAAAWFNAHEFGEEAYGLSPGGVVELVQSMMLTDPLGLKEILEALNVRGA
jgi:hypothetical protein